MTQLSPGARFASKAWKKSRREIFTRPHLYFKVVETLSAGTRREFDRELMRLAWETTGRHLARWRP